MLIQRLIKRQRSLGLTDVEFARRLGIHQSYWSLIKAGRRRPGRRFLAGVATQFPDLQPECLIFLRSDMTVGVA